MLAKAVCQAIEMLAIPTPSRASPAPTGFAVCTRLVITTNPVWERACSRKRCIRQSDAECSDAFAGKPGSHRFCGVHKASGQHSPKVGAGLLAKAVCQAIEMLAIPTPSRASPAPTGFAVCTRLVINTAPVWERACSRKRCVRQRDAGYTDAFAGKPGSHRFCGVHKASDHHSSSVGASLLAKAVCQAIEMLAIPTPSRASPAPTGFAVCTRLVINTPQSGSGLARESGVSGNEMLAIPTLSRASPAPTGFAVCTRLVINTAPVWERACSRKRCVRQRDAGYTDAFAGKPGSHRFCGVQKACDHHQSSVGAGLLAKATGQAPSSVRRTLSSSSLIWNGLTSISMPLPRNTWRLIAVSA